MFKRLFSGLAGLGAGIAFGVWAVRKLERTRSRLAPGHLSGVAAGRAGELRARLAAAVEEGRRAAAGREAELRAAYGGNIVREPAPGSAGGEPDEPDAF